MNVGDPRRASGLLPGRESDMPIVVKRAGIINRKERRGITAIVLFNNKPKIRIDVQKSTKR